MLVSSLYILYGGERICAPPLATDTVGEILPALLIDSLHYENPEKNRGRNILSFWSIFPGVKKKNQEVTIKSYYFRYIKENIKYSAEGVKDYYCIWRQVTRGTVVFLTSVVELLVFLIHV